MAQQFTATRISVGTMGDRPAVKLATGGGGAEMTIELSKDEFRRFFGALLATATRLFPE